MSVALWSADYTPMTGQALVTRRVVEQVLPAIGQHREYAFRPGGGAKAIFSWCFAWLRLWRDLAARRIGTLYLVCSRSNAGFIRDIPALLAARIGIRVVVHAHGSDIVDLLITRPLSPLARVLYAPCELVLPSRHLVEPLRGAGLKLLHVCENFNAATNAGDGTPSSPERASLAVIWNSNLMASKGAFDLMEAVRRLAEGGEAIGLQMIGSIFGDEELPHDAAEDRFAEFKGSRWLTYNGRVATTRAAEMVDGADVVALPSRYSSECQPLAVIQAMCAGKAIIVSDIPALRATLGDYPAEFVPIRSVEAIAEALRRIHKEKQTDAKGFVFCRAGPAAEARGRFSTARFDEEMRAILSGR